jgi:hypothetical protein
MIKCQLSITLSARCVHSVLLCTCNECAWGVCAARISHLGTSHESNVDGLCRCCMYMYVHYLDNENGFKVPDSFYNFFSYQNAHSPQICK